MKAPAALKRFSVGLVDQSLSSISNFAATLVAARVLGVAEFGAFSLAILTYTLVLGLNRGLVCEALLVRPGDSAPGHRLRLASATSASFWLGLASLLLCLIGSWFADGATARCLLVIGVAMPALLIQDTQRFASFARGKPQSALISDATWLTVGVVVFTVVLAAGVSSGPVLLAAWAGAGAVGAAVQMTHDTVRPRLRLGIRWTIDQRDLSVRYAIFFMSGQGAAMFATYALAFVAGVAAVGAIRGAQVLFGPLNILLTGTYVMLVPEGRRVLGRSVRRFHTLFVGASVVFASVGVVLTGLLLLLSPERGTQLLGPTWDNARTVLLPVGLAAVAGGALSGATAGLKAMTAAQELLRSRMLTMPATILLPMAGALVGDGVGLAIGIAVSVWWNAGWYWLVYRSTFKRRVAASTGPRGTGNALAWEDAPLLPPVNRVEG